jgi:BirA family biotin operon repressor/biotin-[acetyl-CoA-carboxylase] ligase
MAVAVAAAEAVEGLTGRTPRLKWPNDLVWPGDGTGPDRKLAGILAEVDWPAGATASGGPVVPGPGDRAAVAVGLGLNVAWGDRTPAHLADIAVALDEIVAPEPPPDRVELLVAVLRSLDSWYGPVGDPASAPADRAGAAERLRDEWRHRSATIGRRVRVDLGTDDVEGTAVDVTADGHLVVETLEGARRTLAVGDVVHLRT